METHISIDTASGIVSVGTLSIGPDLKPSDLPGGFSIGQELPVITPGSLVACQFAAAHLVENGQLLRLELRFEHGVLVSCFFTFPGVPPGDEHRACGAWLTEHIGAASGLVRFAWGCAGVASDRSGDSHVFLHNKNNHWAHGAVIR